MYEAASTVRVEVDEDAVVLDVSDFAKDQLVFLGEPDFPPVHQSSLVVFVALASSVALPVGRASTVSQTRHSTVVLALLNIRCSLLHSSQVTVMNDFVMASSTGYEADIVFKRAVLRQVF